MSDCQCNCKDEDKVWYWKNRATVAEYKQLEAELKIEELEEEIRQLKGE